MRVLSCLRASINPPPPGVGCANGRTICGCGRDGGLLAFIVSCRSLAERSFAFVLPDVRVFLSCLVFSCLPGRVSVVVVGSRPRFAPCSPSRAFPTACLLSAHVSSVWFGRFVAPCPLVLVLAIAGRCRVIPSVRFLASPPSASAFRLSSPMRLVLSLSALLVSCLASPCLAVPRPDRRSACFARFGLVAVLPLVRLSCCLTSFRLSPRLACRRTGR